MKYKIPGVQLGNFGGWRITQQTGHTKQTYRLHIFIRKFLSSITKTFLASS